MLLLCWRPRSEYSVVADFTLLSFVVTWSTPAGSNCLSCTLANVPDVGPPSIEAAVVTSREVIPSLPRSARAVRVAVPDRPVAGLRPASRYFTELLKRVGPVVAERADFGPVTGDS